MTIAQAVETVQVAAPQAEQFGVWFTALGVAVAILTALVAILALGAAFWVPWYLRRQSREFTEAAQERIESYREHVEQMLEQSKGDVAKALASYDDIFVAFLQQQRNAIESAISKERAKLNTATEEQSTVIREVLRQLETRREEVDRSARALESRPIGEIAEALNRASAVHPSPAAYCFVCASPAREDWVVEDGKLRAYVDCDNCGTREPTHGTP